MESLQPPPSLQLTGNLAENWSKFRQMYDIYAVASGISEKGANVQGMTLLHVLGPEAIEIYNTFTWDEGEDKTEPDVIKAKFEEYCNPGKNITYERYIFNTRNQRDGETFDDFVTDLRQKASTCEYGTMKDSLIRDKIVCGIKSDAVRARLLRERELTLQGAIDICSAAAASSTAQIESFGDEKSGHILKQRENSTKQRNTQVTSTLESKPKVKVDPMCKSTSRSQANPRREPLKPQQGALLFKEPLTASMLAAAPPQEQKQMLGERLFPLIQRMYPELAGKITGMLLEIDNSELLHMLESHEALKSKVKEAVAVLQAHQAK